MTKSTKQDLPVILFESQEDWEAWLEEHYETFDGLWLKIAKKDSGIDSISYSEALDVALCYGWIDSQKASFDDKFWLQRFTPRKSKSKWSKVNRNKVTQLIEQGKMKAAGLEEVEQAKQDGRWDRAYDSQRNATVPDDFQQQLDSNPRAQQFFATLNSTNRYAILYQIQDAKKPETRARRIEKYITMLNEQKKIY